MPETPTIAERLLKLKKKAGISYTDLERLSGIPRTALQRYFSSTTEKIPLDRIERIAEAFGVSPASIMGWPESAVSESIVDRSQIVDDQFPHPLGNTPAIGVTFFLLDQFFAAVITEEDTSGLKIDSNSTLLLRKTNRAANGQLVAARQGGIEALYRYTEHGNTIVLIPASQSLEPMLFKKADLENGRLEIFGAVVKVMTSSELE